MNKRPIGAWSGVALLTLILSLWLGYKGGTGIAHARNSAQQRTMGSLSAAERAHLKAVLQALSRVQTLRFAAAHDLEKLRSNLLFEIENLENLRAQPDMQGVRPVVDLYLGIAYANLAILEERANNTSRAREYIQLAQEVFRSLGWQDYSEEALRAVAQREIDKWTFKTSREPTQK